MRDIRNDIKERLDEATARRTKIVAEFEQQQQALVMRRTSALSGLEREIATLQNLFDIESRRMGPTVTGPGVPAHQPTLPLADFIVNTTIQTGPRTKDELRALAERAGYFPEGIGGRTIHATTMNLLRANKLAEDEHGRFAPPRVPETIGAST